jgi:hypothetical protein
VRCDVIKYLDARGISHSSGKNVSAGWVGIQCVYPLCDDTSNHLGINLQSGLHSCWKCGNKGGPEQLVMHVDQCGYGQAADVVRQYSSGLVALFDNDRPAMGSFMLPKFSSTEPHSVHAAYLASRGYDWRELVAMYGIRFTGPVAYVDTSQGRKHYRWRIIIPVFINAMVVNFTSRDITGKSEARYKSAPDEIAMTPGGDVVYGIDHVEPGKPIAVMEGPFDVWRVGPGAVGMLGTVFTEPQLALISSKQPSRVYVVYDSGASDIAEELGSRMARLVPRVDYLWLDPGKDPDTLSLTDLNRLRRLLAI